MSAAGAVGGWQGLEFGAAPSTSAFLGAGSYPAHTTVIQSYFLLVALYNGQEGPPVGNGESLLVSAPRNADVGERRWARILRPQLLDNLRSLQYCNSSILYVALQHYTQTELL